MEKFMEFPVEWILRIRCTKTKMNERFRSFMKNKKIPEAKQLQKAGIFLFSFSYDGFDYIPFDGWSPAFRNHQIS